MWEIWQHSIVYRCFSPAQQHITHNFFLRISEFSSEVGSEWHGTKVILVSHDYLILIVRLQSFWRIFKYRTEEENTFFPFSLSLYKLNTHLRSMHLVLPLKRVICFFYSWTLLICTTTQCKWLSYPPCPESIRLNCQKIEFFSRKCVNFKQIILILENLCSKKFFQSLEKAGTNLTNHHEVKDKHHTQHEKPYKTFAMLLQL